MHIQWDFSDIKFIIAVIFQQENSIYYKYSLLASHFNLLGPETAETGCRIVFSVYLIRIWSEYRDFFWLKIFQTFVKFIKY